MFSFCLSVNVDCKSEYLCMVMRPLKDGSAGISQSEISRSAVFSLRGDQRSGRLVELNDHEMKTIIVTSSSKYKGDCTEIKCLTCSHLKRISPVDKLDIC